MRREDSSGVDDASPAPLRRLGGRRGRDVSQNRTRRFRAYAMTQWLASEGFPRVPPHLVRPCLT